MQTEQARNFGETQEISETHKKFRRDARNFGETQEISERHKKSVTAIKLECKYSRIVGIRRDMTEQGRQNSYALLMVPNVFFSLLPTGNFYIITF